VTLLCAPGSVGKDGNCFREEITEHLRVHGPIPGLTVVFVEHPPLSFLFQRESSLCRKTVYYIGYKAWQRAAYAVAAEMHRAQRFDLIHQLNMTGYREPGFLWKLDLPFVWGPVAGALNFPAEYFSLVKGLDAMFYRVRTIMNERQKRSARCLAAAKRAAYMWAVGPEDNDLVSRVWGHQVEPMTDSGASPQEKAALHEYDASRPLRVIWSGRHLGRKALPILLQAMAKLKPESKVELTVLGDGPETGHWRGIADSLGLKNIEWAGNLSHGAALSRVAASDVLAFTSVLEGTPHTVVEAVSLGVPVICHRACGMGSIVTPDCGILVEMKDPASSTAAFAAALDKLCAQPGEIARMSQGALNRTNEISWDRLVDKILVGYDFALARAQLR
jgi:glycosyltransferase involved in cell wall biosynthesis